MRFWAVREPKAPTPAARLPRALSRLPVPSTLLPAWELFEVAPLRVLPPEPQPPAVTAVHVGDGLEKLLWTGDEEGGLRSWRLEPPSKEKDKKEAAA